MTDNERIARAADLGIGRVWPIPFFKDIGDKKDVLVIPDWRNDPGAVATHLLPVLEKRIGEFKCRRVRDTARMEETYYWTLEHESIKPFVWTKSFHEAIIAAILATGDAQ